MKEMKNDAWQKAQDSFHFCHECVSFVNPIVFIINVLDWILYKVKEFNGYAY